MKPVCSVSLCALPLPYLPDSGAGWSSYASRAHLERISVITATCCRVYEGSAEDTRRQTVRVFNVNAPALFLYSCCLPARLRFLLSRSFPLLTQCSSSGTAHPLSSPPVLSWSPACFPSPALAPAYWITPARSFLVPHLVLSCFGPGCLLPALDYARLACLSLPVPICDL
ncbi:hypothetical protein NQD34_011715 [Periophthalmus magnuspinnatus]|nr:hypothetical protein NQD34_011715 [Periophthalmus magnuspinnatus]